MDNLLTVDEVAAYFRVSRNTVWRWCQTGQLHAVKVGHNWRIRRSDMEKMLERPDEPLTKPPIENRL